MRGKKILRDGGGVVNGRWRGSVKKHLKTPGKTGCTDTKQNKTRGEAREESAYFEAVKENESESCAGAGAGMVWGMNKSVKD